MQKIIVFFSIAICALYSAALFAAEYAPSITYYPRSLVIPYGVTDKSFTLDFDIVNNYNLPLSLSNAQFKLSDGSSGDNSPIKNVQVTFVNAGKCVPDADGKSATMPAQGPDGICHIKLSFDATGVQPKGDPIDVQAYQLTIDYVAVGQLKSTVASENVQIRFASGALQPALARTFHVTNDCAYPVWVGIHSSAVQSLHPVDKTKLTSCRSSDDCYPGSSCVTPDSSTGQCFWDLPVPSSHEKDVYKVVENGGTTTVTFPVYDNGSGFYATDGAYIPYEITWAGGITGRVNCTAAGCELGDCGGGAGACKPGQGFLNPLTAAEFALQKIKTIVMSNDDNLGNVDTYDVTVINGVSVPVSMEPAEATWGGETDPFTCGPAGGTKVSEPLAACSWSFTPPSNDYIYVSYPVNSVPKACKTNDECGSGMVCGIGINRAAVDGLRIKKICGTPSGFYWTAQAICASDPTSQDSPVDCNGTVGNGTYKALFGCDAPFNESCYSSNASSNCCGCNNWVKLFPEHTFEACVNSNKTWTNNALPGLEWLKKGCPLAYVYPYDDKSSTFTCKKLNADKVNVVNYNVTFCPHK